MTNLVHRFNVFMDHRCNDDSNYILSQGVNISPNGLAASINLDLHEYFDFANTNRLYIAMASAEYTINTANQFNKYRSFVISARENIIDSYDNYRNTEPASMSTYGHKIDSDDRFNIISTLPISGAVGVAVPTYFTFAVSHQILNEKKFRIDQKELCLKVYIEAFGVEETYKNLPGIPFAFQNDEYINMHFDIYKE